MAHMTIVALDGIDVVEIGEEADFTFPADFADGPWKSSEAFARSDGSSARPTIKITESTIWVYWQTVGNAAIVSSNLSGDGGDYAFTQPNQSYNIEPGTYRHSITGRFVAPPASSIASGIRYK